jgi:GrpB-like predicted nucleotidyltransferase (UPF0157 family)
LRVVRSIGLDVHLHICRSGSAWERRHLLFRDWLRTDAADRSHYSAVKLELAKRDWADIDEYAAAKTEVIEHITERAEIWARSTSWSVR